MTLSPAIYSGVCSSFASLFGKLSGVEFTVFLDVKLRYVARLIFFCLMVLLNSLVWTFFVKALQTSKTAVEATAVSTATNYILSGILGFVAFGEVTGLLWWFGISLVVIGVIMINNSSLNLNKETNKR